MNTIVIIWIFSCVFAWAFTSSATSMGETISDGFRQIVRMLGLITSLTAITTTAILWPVFLVAFAQPMAASLIVWMTIHLSGATFTVVANSYRLATCTL